MPLMWKPEVWAKLAQSKPDTFLRELAEMRSPSASLFTKTYIQCAVQGFRGLRRHDNWQYEAAFFQELAKRLPHEEAKKAEKYDIGSIQHLDIKRAPIEYLLWQDALHKRLNPAKKLDYHAWLLQLRKPGYDPLNEHARFSLVNAPEWASGYTDIQRGKTSNTLRAWLLAAPIAECLGVVNAAGSLHGDEKPLWLTHCLETVLSRKDDMLREASVYDTMSAMTYAWKMPSPALDAAIVDLACDQPKGMSILTHAWFGGHYGREPYTPMLDWWTRQTPTNRGAMLHRWLGEGSNWESLSKEAPHDLKPGLALDMFTRDPIDISPALSRDIVIVAPFENPTVRAFLPRVIPAMHGAELVSEPKNFKPYLLQVWDTFHEMQSPLSVDGLLDFEP